MRRSNKITKDVVLFSVAVTILIFYLYVFVELWNANKVFGIIAGIFLACMYIVIVKYFGELRRWKL